MVHLLPDGPGNFQYIFQIGAAVFIGWRSYCTEDDLHLVKARFQFRCEMEPAGVPVSLYHIFKTGFVNGDDAPVQVFDFFRIDIDAINFRAHFGEAGSAHQADISCPYNRDFHN